MGTVPVPHTWTAGDDATSTVLQTLTDAINYLLGNATSGGSKKPLCRARQSIAQTLTTATNTAILQDAEDVDYDNGHSTVTNTSRYTAQTAGWYDVVGYVAFTGNATGVRLAFLAKNGTEIGGTRTEVASSGAGVTGIATLSDLVFLNVGDWVEVWAQQTSGGNLALTASTLDVALASN